MPARLARSFPPIATPGAKALVLGSMPGEASLAAGEYYAHPRNAFWPIMAELLGMDRGLPYAERARRLTDAGVAVWDVLRCCRRRGSLDAAIDPTTERPNDFGPFFAAQGSIELVAFNGQKAEASYRRHVLPGLPSTWRSLPTKRLPSTSPAHAGRSFDQKLRAWREALVLLRAV